MEGAHAQGAGSLFYRYINSSIQFDIMHVSFFIMLTPRRLASYSEVSAANCCC